MAALQSKQRESGGLKNGKPCYSPSRLSLYARCPRMFALAEDYRPAFTSSQLNSFRDGKLFEGYVFGFKSMFEDNTQEALEGRKKDDTLQIIKDHADYVRPLFEDRDGQSFVWMEHEMENYFIQGEGDYIGSVNTDHFPDILLDVHSEDLPEKMIIDLKYTADISRTWDFKGSDKIDYIQAAFYPYLHFKATGELLPFLYLVVESFYKRPIVRGIFLDIKPQVMDWVESLVQKINEDVIFRPFCNKITCLGDRNQSRCSYMDVCEHGRRLMGGIKKASFMELGETYFFNYQNEENGHE